MNTIPWNSGPNPWVERGSGQGILGCLTSSAVTGDLLWYLVYGRPPHLTMGYRDFLLTMPGVPDGALPARVSKA